MKDLFSLIFLLAKIFIVIMFLPILLPIYVLYMFIMVIYATGGIWFILTALALLLLGVI